MVVQHNLRAMNSNRMLGLTSNVQSKSTEKLSSGYKINRAADDAAGLSISEKMRKQIRGLTQASLNAEDGISAVQTAEGALNEVQDMLQRMNELAVKAANGTMSENDRSYIQNEIDQLITEIDRVAETTKFNETYLLKGDRNADKVATFSYAEAMSVEFGEDVSVLYAADGTEFKNAEALEEYLLANPNAEIYKSPAKASAGEENTGVKEVTVKTGATGLPDEKTKYTFDGTGWTSEEVADPTAAYPGPMTIDAPEYVDVSSMFEFDKAPVSGDTFTFTPAEKAVKGTDYTVTTTRGNTGNNAVGSLKDTDKVEDDEEDGGDDTVSYTAFTSEDDLIAALADSTKTVYKLSTNDEGEVVGTVATSSDVRVVEAEEVRIGDVLISDDTMAQAYSSVNSTDGFAGGKFADLAALKTAITGGTSIYSAAEGEDLKTGAKVYAEGDVVYGADLGFGKFGLQDVADEDDGGEDPASLAQTPMLAAAGETVINDGQMNGTTVIDLTTAFDDNGDTIKIGDNTYTKAAAKNATNKEYSSLADLKELALADGYVIEGDAENAVTIKEKEADAPAYTEDAVYYDADGNKISANALGNYIEFNEEEGSVKFKADARPIYADKEATQAVTNDMLKDDIVVAKDNLVGALELKLHVGADATSNNQISVKLDAMSAKGLGVENMKVDGADDTNALDAIETIKEAIQKVSTQRSALGAVQNRLEHTINNLDNVVENTTAAESQIRDTDMASEMVKYSNNNILAQAGQAMLAQANQSNQGVLSLLG